MSGREVTRSNDRVERKRRSKFLCAVRIKLASRASRAFWLSNGQSQLRRHSLTQPMYYAHSQIVVLERTTRVRFGQYLGKCDLNLQKFALIILNSSKIMLGQTKCVSLEGDLVLLPSKFGSNPGKVRTKKRRKKGFACLRARTHRPSSLESKSSA